MFPFYLILVSPFRFATAGVMPGYFNQQMCEHLWDTTIPEILKNNDYGAKGFWESSIVEKSLQVNPTLNIQKGTNTRTDHHLPSDKKTLVRGKK